uniref:TERF1-interacting nuclear factor 2 N-terminal domain-containing protein n=1 Tax=Monopterus albus TaxID=43700 RepID=A0A3Q3K016_MONAL
MQHYHIYFWYCQPGLMCTHFLLLSAWLDVYTYCMIDDLFLSLQLILELCCTQPDAKVIEPHLKRICAPAALSSSSASAVSEDVKIVRTVENFHSLVHMLLTDPAKRGEFFREEFSVHFGPEFDQDLEKLLWEFLIRLDQFLPVPNLAQTVSWLSNAPPVLEECAQAATQPQLLKILLQHQACLGHLESAASVPPNLGDSILASLSLPPSGRVPSNHPTSSSTGQSDGTQTRDETLFITPVIGLISNEEVPIMFSASKRTPRGDEPACSKDATNKLLDPKKNLKFTVVKQRQEAKDDGVRDGEEQPEKERDTSESSSRVKRKQPYKSGSDEEEEVLAMTTPGKKRLSRSMQDRGDQGTNEGKEDRGKTVRNSDLANHLIQLGVRSLHLPQNPALCSIFLSCLCNQPRVVINKLSVASVSTSRTGGGEMSLHEEQQNQRKKSLDETPTRKSTSSQPRKLDSEFPGLADKENHLLSVGLSSTPSWQRSNTETLTPPGDGEDYVADSEDEGTKNFKGRLFMKRYYKTKHGTYVPTLREFWKPGMARRDSSTGSRRR